MNHHTQSGINDPNGVAVHNGQLFGLRCREQEAKIVALPVPWDVTTSYRPGTCRGPQAILEASYQLDLTSPWVEEAWKLPLFFNSHNLAWQEENHIYRQRAEAIIQALEAGEDLSPQLQMALKDINRKSQELTSKVCKQVNSYLEKGISVLTVGGDHSISLGPILAYSQTFSDLSILHIDAHADLREAYENFEESHASIMWNVLDRCPRVKIVQVGIRDYAPAEHELICSNQRLQTYFDWDLKRRQAKGESWHNVTQEIISHLSHHVYVSVDVDGLDPKLCPHTGTPVPGGLELYQLAYLIEGVFLSGRKIVGADLVEVAPGPNGDQWDGNVGARILFMLACGIWKSRGLD